MAESGCLNDGSFQNLQIDGKVSVTGSSLESGMNYKTVVDQRLLNTGGDVTTTLTRAQSGTLFLIDGTGDIEVTLPDYNTANVGVTYEFLVTTAVGGGKTVTFTLDGSSTGTFWAAIILSGDDSTSTVTYGTAGDVLTLVNSTVISSRVKLTCVNDNGTNSTWMADVIASPLATVA